MHSTALLKFETTKRKTARTARVSLQKIAEPFGYATPGKIPGGEYRAERTQKLQPAPFALHIPRPPAPPAVCHVKTRKQRKKRKQKSCAKRGTLPEPCRHACWGETNRTLFIVSLPKTKNELSAVAGEDMLKIETKNERSAFCLWNDTHKKKLMLISKLRERSGMN